MFTSTTIKAGDVIEGARLGHGDYLKVTGGGEAYNVTVGYKADLKVTDNGVVSGVTIQEGGEMVINNASAYGVKVSNDGGFHIADAITSGLSVAEGGNARISDKGVVTGVNVAAGGNLTLESGGIISGTVAGNLTALTGGIMKGSVAAGAFVNGFEITSQYNNTADGFFIKNAYISKGGAGYVLAEQTLEGLLVEYLGRADLKSGSLLSGANVSSGGNIYVSAGASATKVNLNAADGQVTVYNKADASDIVAKNGGIINVYGNVSGALTSSGAHLNIYNTGKVTSAILASGAILDVRKGGAINGFTANANNSAEGFNISNATVYDEATVYSGCVVSDITVASGGAMSVTKNGVVSGASINSAGEVTVSGGAAADKIVVNAGGSLTVLSGAALTSANIKAGEATISQGAIVTDFSVNGGTVYQKKDAAINGFTFNNDYTHSGNLYFNGASVKAKAEADLNKRESALNVTVQSAGVMDVNAGANASATKVTSGGKLNIYGNAAGTIVSKGGAATVSKGGVAIANVVENGGKLTAVDGGVISDSVINTANTVAISSGGVANNLTVDTNGVLNVYAAGQVKGGSIRNNGKTVVHSGGSALSIAVNNGSLELANGAYAAGNKVNSKGEIVVNSGAVAENTAVLFEGIATVNGGATAINTTVSSKGTILVNNGGSVKQLKLEKGAVVNGLTIQTTQTADGVKLNGAVVSCHTEANLYNEQSANGTVVQSSAVLNAFEGATLTSTTLNHGGLRVSGGQVNTAVINDNGMILARSGAILNNVDVQHGEMFVYDAVANDTTVKSFGKLYVNNGVLNDTIVTNGNVSAAQGSEINDIIVRGGNMIAKGVVNNATLVAGNISAAENAQLNNTVISGGTLTLADKAVHSGTMYVSKDATVAATAGATIDFGVAGKKAASSYIINDLSRVTGAPTYTVTVDVNESVGIYNLAQGADSFNKTILIKNTDDKKMFYATTNGDSVHYEGMLYSLNQSAGNLTLKVSEQERSSISANGVSQIIAWDANRGTVGMVATTKDSGATWQGIWDWSGCCGTGKACCVDKWRVAGTGRFKGTEINTDGILLYNTENNTFAVWSDISNASYGYVSLCHVEANFSVKAIGNFNNNQYDDIIIYDEKGSFGVVIDGTTYYDIWHVEDTANNNIELVGAGYFGNPNGTESLVIKNTADNTYYIWDNSDTTFGSWSWQAQANAAGKVEKGWEIVAIGDFRGDFIDDIIVMNDKGEMFAWENGNSQKQSWVGKVDAGDWEVAAVGDYNADGKEDLLLRELVTGWGGLGYWGAAYADNWVDLNARVENNEVSNFAVIA